MDTETITTRSVGVDIANINEDFVLDDSPRSRTVLRAQIHAGGARGEIIRFRKGVDGTLEEIVPTNFNLLHENDGIKIPLDTAAAGKLNEAFTRLTELLAQQGVQYGINQFTINPSGALVITDENKASIIRGLIEHDLGEEVWEQISTGNPNLASRLAAAQLQEEREKVLAEFMRMLEDENLGEGDWQDFFETHTWIFGYGLRYQILRTVQSQPNYGGTTVTGRGGQRGDFLSTTEANVRFTTLVEIKKPQEGLLGSTQYRNGAWSISSELAGAISQVQINCSTWEIEGSRTDANREAMATDGIYTIKPRGIVVIGNLTELDSREKRSSFEQFRNNLANPEIITYDELYERTRYIVQGNVGIDESVNESTSNLPINLNTDES